MISPVRWLAGDESALMISESFQSFLMQKNRNKLYFFGFSFSSYCRWFAALLYIHQCELNIFWSNKFNARADPFGCRKLRLAYRTIPPRLVHYTYRAAEKMNYNLNRTLL